MMGTMFIIPVSISPQETKMTQCFRDKLCGLWTFVFNFKVFVLENLYGASRWPPAPSCSFYYPDMYRLVHVTMIIDPHESTKLKLNTRSIIIRFFNLYRFNMCHIVILIVEPYNPCVYKKAWLYQSSLLHIVHLNFSLFSFLIDRSMNGWLNDWMKE